MEFHISSGVAMAVVTAMLQSVTYILSRVFFSKGGTPLQLLYANQMMMMAVSLPLLFIALPAPEILSWRFIGWMSLSAIGFLAGQLCWFSALRKVEGSKLASLYNLKIVVVGVAYSLFLRSWPGWYEIAGLGLAVAAAMMMNYRYRGKSVAGEKRGIDGKGFSTTGMGMLSGAIIFLSCSDVGATAAISMVNGAGVVDALIIAVCMENIFAGVMTAPLWKVAGFKAKHLKMCAGYTACCLTSIITIYYCFLEIGPVYTNVVISVRGIFSLLFGVLLAWLGWRGVESRVSLGQWAVRAVAALSMFAAIVIYSCGKIQA